MLMRDTYDFNSDGTGAWTGGLGFRTPGTYTIKGDRITLLLPDRTVEFVRSGTGLIRKSGGGVGGSRFEKQ